MHSPGVIRIYTDGSCEFCRWARSLVEPHDRDHQLLFRDFNTPGVAQETPYDLATLSQRMHVQSPDGNWHSGFWGWIAIFDVIPRYRWLGRLLRWMPFRWLGPWFYDLLARNRYRIPHVLLRVLGVPRPCDVSCAVPSPHPEP